jgi:hypothetical protein
VIVMEIPVRMRQTRTATETEESQSGLFCQAKTTSWYDYGQELGDVDPALFRPQPAHTDGPLTQSSERVIIMTRRAAQATRGHHLKFSLA